MSKQALGSRPLAFDVTWRSIASRRQMALHNTTGKNCICPNVGHVTKIGCCELRKPGKIESVRFYTLVGYKLLEEHSQSLEC